VDCCCLWIGSAKTEEGLYEKSGGGGGMTFSPLGALGPEIKAFIALAAVAGLIAIGMLLLIIKRIEQADPDRIRWR